VGKPVDVITGNVFLDQTDADATGRRQRVRLTRSYNSALSVAVGARPALGHEFGPGWTHNFERQLRHPDPSSTASFSLRLGEGHVLYFAVDPQVSGTYRALVPSTERSWLVDNGTTVTRYLPDGSTETYNSAGRLAQTADAIGVTTTLHYDAQGRLDTITDIGGRHSSSNTTATARA
jgi:YD repeat-containing protein